MSAWDNLPDALKAHPGVKALRREAADRIEADAAEIANLRGWLEAEAQAAGRLQHALNNADNNAERDEALLRQALDALAALTDYATNTSEAERMGNAAIAALTARLGET